MSESDNSENANLDDAYTIDDDVKDELSSIVSEEQLIGMFQAKGSGEERVPIVKDFAPDKDDWGGKTVFRPGQPRQVTLAANLAEAFPVLKPTEALIKQVITDYEKRLTSVDGVARSQLKSIFRGMFGAGVEGESDSPGAVRIALSQGPEDND